MNESGTICAQYVRCGRKNCRCARGALHGPYYYRFTREGGQLRKQYIRKAEVEAAQESLATEKRLRQLRRSVAEPAPRRSRSMLDEALQMFRLRDGADPRRGFRNVPGKKRATGGDD